MRKFILALILFFAVSIFTNTVLAICGACGAGGCPSGLTN